MKVIDVKQGSQAWLNLRSTHDTASEASAALGVSKYQSRTALMHQKKTGFVEDVGAAKQALFNRGHDAEASARALAEEIIGESLYPVTATLEVEGLSLLASLDGSTMAEEILWEHKLWSESLAADVREGNLHPHYTLQMDQQLLVSGAEKCLFMTSDGTEDKMAWCWYETTPEKKAALIAGWHQFKEDLAAYVPPEVIVAPVAAPQMGLPAVSITVNGSIALVDNLDKFGAALTAYVERINKKPESDQDFADLELTVKTLKTAEEALDAAETNALAQTDSIDAMRRTVALYRETARTNRLLVTKLVTAEKENRRIAIVSDAAAELVTHVRKLNERLGKPYMPAITADLQGVIKGLKSLDSMKDKVATELARCKIAANEAADRIQANLTTLRELASEHAFLFADAAQLVGKANDDLTALVKSRIADHKDWELAEEKAKEEAMRLRIQAEEQAKAEQAARDKLAAEQAERDRIAAEAAKVERIVTAPDVAPVTPPGPAAAAITHAQVVQQMPATVRRAMAPAETPPTLTLGEISTRLGFNCTSAFLSTLGFESTTVKAAKLFHQSDFVSICEAIKTHISEVQDQFETAAA